MDVGGSCNSTGLNVNMVSMDSCSAWQPSDAGERGLDEFLHCGSVENVCNDVYRLHSLFKLDDFEHFASGVAERYGFQMYDVLHCDSMNFHANMSSFQSLCLVSSGGIQGRPSAAVLMVFMSNRLQVM